MNIRRKVMNEYIKNIEIIYLYAKKLGLLVRKEKDFCGKEQANEIR